jgi:GNAT superfamily N-acetyltransferase
MASGELALGDKVLLTREAQASLRVPPLDLEPIRDGEEWSRYEALRGRVEAEFGLDASEARRLVQRTQERGATLDMRMWLGRSGENAVGAIGAFRLTGPLHAVAGLQEVDVFPHHRRRGYGRQLLEAVRITLVEEGVRWLVIGADEEDWPLGWYIRLSFRPVLRVVKWA